LLEAGAVSVTLQDSEDQPLYEPAPGEIPLWDHVTVVGLFPADLSLEKLEKVVTEKLAPLSLTSFLLAPVKDQDWERVWLKDFKPVQFGETLWVCPNGMAPGTNEGVVMELDPGLAFGTGTHPTTAMCLEWLAEQNLQNLSLIDYGCGSGILGIAALLLGADIVHGVDNDPQALSATRDNCKKNAIVEEKFPLYLPGDFARTLSEGDVQQVDTLLANILAGPLVSLAQYLAAMVKPESSLLLSGILREQADEVMAAYGPWFTFTEPVIQDDWTRLEGKRKS